MISGMDAAKEQGLARTARSQLGLVTRAQLDALGIARSTVTRRVASGQLVPSGRATFRLASAPLGHDVGVLAACLDVDGVASHWTAAWLHGLVPARRTVDVTVRKGRSRAARLESAGGGRVRVHSSTNLPWDDVVRIGPIPTTSVARTMLGLAALVPVEFDAQSFGEIVATAVERGLATDPWLWWLLAQRRCRGRNGVSALETALAGRARLGPTESWLEREVLRILEAAGIPLPVTQRVIARSGRFVARVDFAYEPEGVVLEALGYAFHRSPPQMEADTRRANDLQLLGFDVYQFTTAQIVGSPGSVQRTVRDALDGARMLRAS